MARRRKGAADRAATSLADAIMTAPSRLSGNTTIALVRSNSLPMLVQRELERMILAGELPVGAKLNEALLAGKLGVSRGPVREAFRALEESGLVRLEKNRGVFVRQVGLEEADEIYEVRAALEEWVGRRVARTASPMELKELKAIVERMERAAARNSVDAYHALNLDFHDRLVALGGNAKLLAVYRRLVNELRLFRRQALAQRGTLSTSIQEHRDIVAKIASRNAATAGKALRDHVMNSRARMRRSATHGARGAQRNVVELTSRGSR